MSVQVAEPGSGFVPCALPVPAHESHTSSFSQAPNDPLTIGPAGDDARRQPPRGLPGGECGGGWERSKGGDREEGGDAHQRCQPSPTGWAPRCPHNQQPRNDGKWG